MSTSFDDNLFDKFLCLKGDTCVITFLYILRPNMKLQLKIKQAFSWLVGLISYKEISKCIQDNISGANLIKLLWWKWLLFLQFRFLKHWFISRWTVLSAELKRISVFIWNKSKLCLHAGIAQEYSAEFWTLIFACSELLKLT